MCPVATSLSRAGHPVNSPTVGGTDRGAPQVGAGSLRLLVFEVLDCFPLLPAGFLPALLYSCVLVVVMSTEISRQALRAVKPPLSAPGPCTSSAEWKFQVEILCRKALV